MGTAKKSQSEEFIVSSITSKGQTTVPLEIRRLLDVKPGDDLKYEIVGPGVVHIKKLSHNEILWAKALEGTLSEWMDASDDDL